MGLDRLLLTTTLVKDLTMFRQRPLCFALVLGCASLWASLAQAHFLFIRVGTQAEAGRYAEVYFSEQAQAGDPRFVAKVAHTKLWLQSEPGKFAPLTVTQATDRLRALIPTGGSVSITGSCEYGVLKRDVAFLLRYYPKAISGSLAELAKFERHPELPVEIVSSIENGTVVLTALKQGQPIPGATFTTIDAQLNNEELKADERGRAVWKPSSSGSYCVYTKVVTPTSGSLAGVNYSEVREFATLAFDWPLGATDPQAEAVAMFQKAIAARAVWPAFHGFTAKIAGQIDGRSFSGTVSVAKNNEVKLDVNDDTVVEWVSEQLQSIVGHRQAGPQRGAPSLRFGDDDRDHPLGRLLIFQGGRFASSYRVRGDELTVVNRNLGEENMSITVQENERNSEGKLLPRIYSVQYWDAQSGALRRVEAFQNRWVRVGALDLPASLSFVVSNSSGLSTRHFRLENHQLAAEAK